MREPSLDPYFGIKGGDTGAGLAQVVPAEDINLHFVGDMYAVEEANSLLAAMVDNHLQHGNDLGIDPRRIVLRRVIDTIEPCGASLSAWAGSNTAFRAGTASVSRGIGSDGDPMPGAGLPGSWRTHEPHGRCLHLQRGTGE